MAKINTILDSDNPEFTEFLRGCEKIHLAYFKRMDYSQDPDEFSFTQGRRYIKVIRGGSVHCFVDRTNGDVLKAASWKAPAKHSRGNVFDGNIGLGSMNEFGPAYLRR